jgi:hypothetical protein
MTTFTQLEAARGRDCVGVRVGSGIASDRPRLTSTEQIGRGAVEGQEAFGQLERTIHAAQNRRPSADDHAESLYSTQPPQKLEELARVRFRERRVQLWGDQELRAAPE